MATFERRTAQVDGERIAYTDEGAGPGVLLIHGAVTNRHLWDPTLEGLRDRYRLVAPDLVGYGDSSHPEHTHLGVDAQARVLERLLVELDLTPCALVGHGVGGGIAQDLATRHPERATALVLVASVTGTTWPSGDFLRVQQTESPSALDPLQVMTVLELHLLRGIGDPARMTPGWEAPFLAPWEGDEGRDAAWRAIQGLDSRDTMDLEDRIPGLRVPTTLIWGAEDAINPLSRAAHLQALYPHASLEVLPGVGHYPPLEDPEAFTDLLDHALAPATAREVAPRGKSPIP